MSQLLIDIGNSRLKWMVYDELESQTGVLELLADDFAIKINDQWKSLRPDSIVFCSVASTEVTNNVSSWLKNKWQCPVTQVRASEKFMGVTNAYSDPAQLGADRWATLIAARKLVTGAVCIVDCGTATTIDGLDVSGQHIGGAIMPGRMLQFKILKGGTAIEQWQDNLDEKASLPICDTSGAINYGTSYGIAGAIDRLIVEFHKQLGDNMTVLLTGGAAPDIAKLLESEFRMEKDLVLLGLALLGQSNAGVTQA